MSVLELKSLARKHWAEWLPEKVKELKAAGRIRYIGMTSTREYQYEELIACMKSEPLDFVGVEKTFCLFTGNTGEVGRLPET